MSLDTQSGKRKDVGGGGGKEEGRRRKGRGRIKWNDELTSQYKFSTWNVNNLLVNFILMTTKQDESEEEEEEERRRRREG